ncbi:MAG: transporter substrate-binding domain-containing protein [Burkholderiaceae bacterium]|nr:transporter substrate-binding domain-containing protein [Burkholderiaceae bacterium]
MMWRLCRCLLAALLLLSQSSIAETAPIVRIGLDPWPPFSGQGLPDLGMSAEIVSRVFKEAGYQAEIVIQPWSRVEASVRSGDLEVMGNLYYIDDIAKWADYSTPYYRSRVRFVALRDRHIHWKTLSDLKPYEIGVGNGYSFGDVFDRDAGLKKHLIPLTSNGMRMILMGRLDLVIDSEEVIYYHLAHDFAADAKNFEVLDTPVIVQPMSIGVSKTNPHGRQLIGDFNAAFAKLWKDGTIQEIIHRHVPQL